MKRILLVCLTAVLALSANAAWAQDRTVSGKVTAAEDGTSLPGVNVLLKGTTTGTSTDSDGKYTLTIPSTGGTLVFSFIGLQTQEVAVGERTSIDVTMATDATQLSEIVVVGYGSQDRRTLTSAITTVKGDAIAQVPVQSFDQALQGKAPGVQVTVQSGLVGQAPRVRIRGVSSISSSSAPLYVVDGVPAASGNQSAVAGGNALGDINPNDIESVDILKDGAATAIYGSRAAGGVILITTKRGKAGKPKLNYDFQIGANTVAKRYEVLNANEFIAISNEKFATSNTAPQAFPGSNGEDTDWQDVIFQNGLMQSHNLSISGGSQDLAYFVSAGFMEQQGAIVRNAMDRYTMRANLDYKGVKWLDAGMKLSVARQVNNGLNTGSAALSGNVTSALKAFPNVGVYDPANPIGGYNITSDGRALGRGNNLLDIASNYTNVQYTLDKNVFEADNYRLLNNVYAQANIFEGFSIRSQFGIDLVDNNDFQSWDPFHGDGGGSTKGYVYRGAYRALTWNWQTYANYKKTFAESHSIDVTVGYEAQQSTYRNFFGEGTTFSDPSFVRYDLISDTYTTQTSGGGYEQFGFDSYFGRLGYDYKGKYLIGVSFRNDAISSLPLDNRQGTFLGYSLGWNIAEEGFLDASTFSVLKLRASYAEVGNANLANNFLYVGIYSGSLYGTQSGLSFAQVGNPALQWETSSKLDIGIEFGLFNNRLSGSVDYYKNDIDNMILSAPTPPTAGLPSNQIYKNIGAMVNKGVEVSLGYDIITGDGPTWTANANVAFNKNEITALVDGSDIVSATNPLINRVGESINSIYAFEYAGVNRANGNPLYVKGDGTLVQGNPDNNTYYVYNPEDPTAMTQSTTLSSADLKVLGQTNPKWFGGLSNTVRWKGFDFQLDLTYAGGNKIFNMTRLNGLQMEFVNNTREILNRWTPENPDTDVPRLKYANSSFLNVNSSRFVEDGDYLRLQNISLGYNIPKSLLESFSKGTISTVRIYGQVRNAYTFTKYKGVDPEMNNGVYGIDNNSNPLLRTFVFGLSVGL